MVEHARLLHLLNYDPETGAWTWRNPNPRSGRYVGQEAGWVDFRGYRIIRVDCGSYRSARLAWFYMTEEWPELEIDHINRDRSDDSWTNLRSVSSTQNLRNRGFDTMRGISCCGRKLQVSVCGQYLGLFERLEEALAIRNFALWYNGATP